MPMSRTAAAALLLALSGVEVSIDAARIRHTSSGFLKLGAKLQPEFVAQTLVGVEDQWKTQVTTFAECSAKTGDGAAECTTASKAFEKSCSTVANAVIQASNGDHDVVREYMDDVCDQKSLVGWRETRCRSFAAFIEGAMTDNNLANRDDLDTGVICKRFWSSFVADEHERVHKEMEEAAKTRAEEKVKQDVIDKKVAEELKRREQVDAEQKATDAQKAADEAQAKATDASVKVKTETVKAEVKTEAEVTTPTETPANVTAPVVEAVAPVEEAPVAAVAAVNVTQNVTVEAAPVEAAPVTAAVAVEANKTVVEAPQNATAAAPVEAPQAAPQNATAAVEPEANATVTTNATNATNASAI